MFRFVVSPDRALVPDLAGKLPGRGIWLSASRDVIEGPRGTRADAKGGGTKGRELLRAVARAARGPVLVPPDLPLVLETALVRRIGDYLGMARRAGQAIAGFEKARDWMRSHPTGLVLQASDGSEAARTRFRSAVPGTVPVLTPLTGAELGRVFGHDNVVHVAVASGRLASSLVMEAGRLAGLRSSPDTAGPEMSPREAARDTASRQAARDTAPRQAAPDTTPHRAAKDLTSHRATRRETAGINDATGTNG